MPDPLTWSAAEVATALGHGVDWFWKNTSRLRAAGFPPPLPIVRRYDPAAVRAWIAAQAGEESERIAGGNREDIPADDADAWGRRLDQRAKALGRVLAGG